MKRIVSITFVVILLLSGCRNSKPSKPKDNLVNGTESVSKSIDTDNAVTTQPTIASETKPNTTPQTSQSTNVSKTISKPPNTTKTTTATTTVPTTITTIPTTTTTSKKYLNQVIFNQDNIKITLMSLDKGLSRPELKIIIENNNDIAYSIQAENLTVNGYTFTPIFYCNVPAKGKLSSQIGMGSYEDLEMCGITKINTVTLNFKTTYNNDISTIKRYNTIQINF